VTGRARLGHRTDTPGLDLAQIPLSLTTAEGSSPQSVRLNELVQGTYTIYLLPKRVAAFPCDRGRHRAGGCAL
jgi:hypothetical protein